ncbi:hypothetical protein ACODUM_08100 [Stenotrophomonas maltophilia]
MAKKRQLTIVSPYPANDRYMDGWMSRIKTIDGVFEDYPRTYIDFQEWYPATQEPEVVYADELIKAYRVNPHSRAHSDFVARIFEAADFVYIHTMHQCEYMLPHFDASKMYVDIHGVVPEEELMLGSPERSRIFSEVERQIVSKLKHASVVTLAMKEHFLAKYPDAANVDFIHVPVFDFGSLGQSVQRVAASRFARRQNARPTAVYAGGAQVWQRVDEMADIMAAAPFCNYEIYSHDVEAFAPKLSSRGIPVEVFKGYASKEKLEQVYRYSNFGFALREACTVNRVASPTKLCDYFAHGVLPVVDFHLIGDFDAYGYAYVDHADFRNGYIPDLQTQDWMIDRNLGCLETMYSDFKKGITAVKDLVETV